MVPTADEAETYSKFEFQTDQTFFTENVQAKFLPMNSKFGFQRFGPKLLDSKRPPLKNA